MSNVKQWWETADGSLFSTKPTVWAHRYIMVTAVGSSMRYWYIEPYTTRIVSPLNEQDLPKELALLRFLLGDE